MDIDGLKSKASRSGNSNDNANQGFQKCRNLFYGHRCSSSSSSSSGDARLFVWGVKSIVRKNKNGKGVAFIGPKSFLFRVVCRARHTAFPCGGDIVTHIFVMWGNAKKLMATRNCAFLLFFANFPKLQTNFPLTQPREDSHKKR